MKSLLASAAIMIGTTLAANAAPLCDNLGFAGLLAKCNRGDNFELTLSSGKPIYEGEIQLQSGVYYQFYITSDGSAELALAGASFFRAIWMNEIVINEIEIRPMAIDSLEFDASGTARLSFIAIKPGRYELGVPGARGDTQKVKISIQ